jgi:hypothetical protein
LDLVEVIQSGFDEASGQFGSSTWDQAWSMIGLAAAGEDVPTTAVSRLADQQSASGGWGFDSEAEPDPDTTGLALQALAAGRESPASPIVQKAIAYLRENQDAGGGWGYTDSEPNTNSTAVVVQGLLAARENPLSGSWSATSDGPVEFMVERQLPEGRFEHSEPPADLMATVQVVPALAGSALPMPGRGVAGNRAARWILAHQDEDGSFHSEPYMRTMGTVDAVLALVALGYEPGRPATSGATAVDYLRGAAAAFADQGPRSAARLAMVADALGHDPHTFGGVDAEAALMAEYNPQTGAFARPSTWNSAWALLGLRACGATIPAAAIEFLKDARNPGGGWGSEVGDDEIDTVSTGVVLQALSAAGVPQEDPAVWQGIEALRSMQVTDGAFRGLAMTGDPEHTARAVGGLVSYGHQVEGLGWSRSRTARLPLKDPIDALIDLQQGDGSYTSTTSSAVYVTTYTAALGLSMKPLPLGRGTRSASLFLPSLFNRY